MQRVDTRQTSNGSISEGKLRHLEGHKRNVGNVSLSQTIEDPPSLILGAISRDNAESQVRKHGRHASAARGELDYGMISTEICAGDHLSVFVDQVVAPGTEEII